ncbi:hypothetical protein, partial [Escherichia coli]
MPGISNGRAAGDSFGTTVAISDAGYIAVGSPGHDYTERGTITSALNSGA